MNEQQIKKIRNSLLVVVIISQVCQLAWEHFNGGVVTHHLLMRSDLPGVSNWWGLVILPLLVWLAAISIKKRASLQSREGGILSDIQRGILIGFFGMLIVSVLQSLIFSLGYHSIAKYMLFGFIIIGLFLPLYRVECILGYVLGATFFSGPAMPFVGVIMFATVSVLIHLCIKPLILRFKNFKQVSA